MLHQLPHHLVPLSTGGPVRIPRQCSSSHPMGQTKYQCCGAATFLGVSDSESLRSPSRLWVSDSDQIGSAPAPGKKRRLQAAPAPCTKIFHFELLKSELLMQVFFDHIYRFKLLLSLSFFACQKDAAGAALKQATPALGSGQQKKSAPAPP